jgi:hypothetical protein
MKGNKVEKKDYFSPWKKSRKISAEEYIRKLAGFNHVQIP